MNNHGGSRKGSGKKTEFEKPMKRTEVTLDEETINFYLAVGDGNLSKGIRQYWRGLTKPAPDAWESTPKKAVSKLKVLSTSQTLSTPTKRR